MAAEGEFDEANTMFIGAHMQILWLACHKICTYKPAAASAICHDGTCAEHPAAPDGTSVSAGPRPRSAMGGTIAGKLVVTPLRDADRNAAAMVVRGWAPAAWEPDRRAAPQQASR